MREIVRDSFGVIGKPSDKWQHDHSIFFNRRSEMGFSGDKGHNLVAGLVGRELFELVYPQWWGGQGKVSQASLTQKVNNKTYEPGSNFACLIPHPSWYSNESKDVSQRQTLPIANEGQYGENNVQVSQPHHQVFAGHRKEKIDPVSMIAAGVRTEGSYYRNMARAFDPSTFYGVDGTINGGSEPVYPLYRDHPYTPPPHIPQARDPTLRSLYSKPSKV